MKSLEHGGRGRGGGGGRKAQWLVYLLSDPAAPNLIHKFFTQEEGVAVAEVKRPHCLEESGLRMLINPI